MKKPIDQIKKDSRERLKAALEFNNMKQAELCKLTGIDSASMSYYISGKYSFKSDKAKLMADVLNVNPVWLMGFDVPMEPEKREPPKGSPQEKLIQLIGKLTPEQQKMVLDLVVAILSK